MSVPLKDVLRKTLDEVDRRRKRSYLLLILLIAFTLSNALAMVWATDARFAMAAGLAAVISVVFGGTVALGRISYDNTLRILKAIELLAGAKSE